MSRFIARGRKTLSLVVSATVLAGGFAASSGAMAKPIVFPKPMPIFKPGPKFGGFGYGAAAIAGGLALGAIAANAVADDCYVVRRVMIDEDGNEYVRRVRVCE